MPEDSMVAWMKGEMLESHIGRLNSRIAELEEQAADITTIMLIANKLITARMETNPDDMSLWDAYAQKYLESQSELLPAQPEGGEMSIYYCLSCDNYIDNDYHPCVLHPTRPAELLCPTCAEEKYGLDPWTGEPIEDDPLEPIELD